ncbi:hypothetical protein [Rhodococcus sp. NPDC058639]
MFVLSVPRTVGDDGAVIVVVALIVLVLVAAIVRPNGPEVAVAGPGVIC